MVFKFDSYIKHIWANYPANIYLFKVNNRNTRKRCEICSKLTIKHQNDELWTHFTPFSSVSFVDFEQVNISWVVFMIQINDKKYLMYRSGINLEINSLYQWKINYYFSDRADFVVSQNLPTRHNLNVTC